MSEIKVSDAAKKAEISVEEAIARFSEVGVNVSGADDRVREEDVVLLTDSKHSQLDRRQEMLKKALERHKKGVKIKEVLVHKGGGAVDATARKVSKEDLMKKRSELEQRIKKVDEDRETIGKEQSAPQEEQPKETVEINVQSPEVIHKEEKEIVPEPAVAVVKEVKNTPKETPKPKETQPVADNKPRERREGDQPYQSQNYQRPQNTTNKSGTYQQDRGGYSGGAGTGNRSSSQPTTRQYGENQGFQRREGRPDDRPSSAGRDGSNFARPHTPRPQGYVESRPQQGSGFQRGERDSTSRPQGDRPFQRRPDGDKGFQGKTGGGFQRDGRTGDKDRNSKFTPETSLTLTQEEERKRIQKKKEDDALKEKESKKPKTKKDATKRPKSWTKTINEGMDELNIEKEVERKPISPHIDISDLADVDPDKQTFKPHNNRRRSNFDKRPKRRHDNKAAQKVFVRPDRVEIGDNVVIADFGSLIGIKATELIKKLFSMGIMATVNQAINAETAQLIGMDYGVEVVVKTITEDDLLPQYIDEDEDLEKRPPIVTVMGHVDHGKTSLLDAIRSTSVASGEAGGITQHIGAYEVESASGKVIFLDTPGHEAFTTLRARGALLTDIVILVVAADDGVKPQTKEAIDHAKAAGVRIVVAINKIDKDGANPDNVRRQLSEYGIISEDWGGEYQFQEISAKKRIGIDDLLERVLLEAEVLDLKGNPNRPADGVVIESRLDKQKGPVATVLVKNGTLKKGDTFISGSQFGKVRAMFNFKGAAIKEAGLSIPAEVMGFSEVPEAGEKFIVVDEKTAKQVAELREKVAREKQQLDRSKLSLADFFGKVKEGELKELNIVLKADAQGSLEALSSSLLKLSNPEVKVSIIHDGIGAITESDVSLASASNAIIIGFNVRPDTKAKNLAEREKIDIELYSVIYKAIDDVKLALEGLLSPEMKENAIGRVEVRQVFSVPKIGKIAGCMVLEGKITRNSRVRLIRDSIVIFDGKISSLKRFTDDVKEVVAGYDCGLSLEKYQDIKEKDILEAYEITEEKRTLEDVAKDAKIREKETKEKEAKAKEAKEKE